MGILEKSYHYDGAQPHLLMLPWIFMGAPLIFNGAPGNIQGNFTALLSSTCVNAWRLLVPKILVVGWSVPHYLDRYPHQCLRTHRSCRWVQRHPRCYGDWSCWALPSTGSASREIKYWMISIVRALYNRSAPINKWQILFTVHYRMPH